MKKILNIIIIFTVCIILQGCKEKTEQTITKETAYEGVNNYCHEKYDWSISKDNPSIMYVEMKDETKEEYQVVFRSYTGAFVYFYVDKETGNTKVMEENPTNNEKEEIDTFQILDYLKKGSK